MSMHCSTCGSKDDKPLCEHCWQVERRLGDYLCSAGGRAKVAAMLRAHEEQQPGALWTVPGRARLDSTTPFRRVQCTVQAATPGAAQRVAESMRWLGAVTVAGDPLPADSHEPTILIPWS